ncbi:MAG: hypothetical protein GY801_08515, partial [bacterium]|nr:hypothetical protein [bacterium]
MCTLKCLGLMFVLQCLFLTAAFGETLMRDDVVVSYNLGKEEAGKFSIEIQNDNRHAVEVILNVYALLSGRALGSIHCNEDFLKSYELQAGRILRVIEPGCEPKRFRTLEAYVKIIGVKPLEAPEELVSEPETPPVEETPVPIAKEKTAPEEQEGLAATTETHPIETEPAEQQPEPEPESEEVPLAAVKEEKPVETPVPEAQEVAEAWMEAEPKEEMTEAEQEPQQTEEEPEKDIDMDPIATLKKMADWAKTAKTDETPIELDTISELMPDAEETPEQAEEKISDPIVEEIQGALQALGYNPGPIDGLMGRKTEAALNAFQETEQMPVDGLPSADILMRLAERQDQLAQAQKTAPKPPETTPTGKTADDTLIYGVLIDGPRESEFLKNLHGEFVRTFREDFILEQKLLVGDWTRATVARNLDSLLDDPEIDAIIALDLIASHEASHRRELPKPVFAPFVLDRVMQQLPLDGSSSGVKNLNYLLSIPKIHDGVEMFRRMASFDKMAVVVARYYYDAFPEMQSYIDERSHFVQKEDGLEVRTVLVNDSVDELLADIPADTEAVYLIPILHFSEEQHEQLIAALNERKLLSFSHLGYDDVEKGVLATIAPKNDFQRLSRRIALNV